MVSTAGTVTSGGWAPAPAGPTVTLAGPSAGGLGLPEPDSAGGPWNHGCTSGGPQRTDRPSRSPSEVPSRRRLGRLGPGGHRGRISACNAATGIPSLRAATVLTGWPGGCSTAATESSAWASQSPSHWHRRRGTGSRAPGRPGHGPSTSR
jgi:hypothetical protein